MIERPTWPRAMAILVLACGCHGAGQDPPSTNHATPPPAQPSATTSGADPSAGAGPRPSASPSSVTPPSPAPAAMPPLADVQVLQIKSRQGGPSHPKCGGVVSELSIDFVKKQWTRGLCMDESTGASPNPNQPLQKRSGSLTAEHRALIEAEYAKMVERPGPSCAADAGATTLTLRRANGSTAELVSPGSSCGNSPPRVADDLREFSSRINVVANR